MCAPASHVSRTDAVSGAPAAAPHRCSRARAAVRAGRAVHVEQCTQAAVAAPITPRTPAPLNSRKRPWRRLLNHLPATRLTATALEAFLRVAGFALWRAYRGQFVKLLQLVDQSFLAALQQVGTGTPPVPPAPALRPGGS